MKFGRKKIQSSEIVFYSEKQEVTQTRIKQNKL